MNEPAPSHEPVEGWQLALQASELLDRRRVRHARTLLARGLQQEPENPRLLFESARADYLEDAYVDARETLTQLLRVAPDDASGRWLLFLVEMESGQLPAAEMLVLGLLKDHPRTPAYFAGYGRLMLRALNFGKARALADEALRLAPNDDEALRLRVLCDMVDRRGRTDSAALAKLLAEHPDDVQTLHLVVGSLVQAGRVREGLALAKELLKAQPDDPFLLSLVRDLRLHTHWSLLPLWPMQKWGWYGSIGIWVGAIVLMQVLRRVAPEVVGPATAVLLAYVAYSWIWPPLLKRLLNRDA